jgi:hypothetical protein
MEKPLRETDYCKVLAEGLTKIGEDISAVEKIYVKAAQRIEIRFAWYKEKGEKRRFIPRPLDLPEDELLELLINGIEKDVFSKGFREKLKNYL